MMYGEMEKESKALAMRPVHISKVVDLKDREMEDAF